jgi:hypothetical protein
MNLNIVDQDRIKGHYVTIWPLYYLSFNDFLSWNKIVIEEVENTKIDYENQVDQDQMNTMKFGFLENATSSLKKNIT